MSVTFEDLLLEHSLAATERQELAGGVIGGRGWSVDLSGGSITFADGPQLAIDLLGSESSTDGSWLWAWANPSLDLPDDRLAASRRMAELGRELSVPELSEEKLIVEGLVSVHTLGVVATGLLGSDAYFVAPTGAFTAVLALRGPELALAPLDGSALTRTLMGGIGEFELEHQPAIAAYLERRGARAEVGDAAWNVLLASGESVVLEFDERQRLLEIKRPEARISTGALEISRQRGGWRDAARSYRILVDDDEQGSLKRGATMRLELPVGPHRVQMRLDSETSRRLGVVIRTGETVRLQCAPGGSARQGLRDLRDNPGQYISLAPAAD